MFSCKAFNGGLQFAEITKIKFKEYLAEHEGMVFDIVPRKKGRTSSQNNALHLWFALVSKELNDAGYPVQLVLKEKIDLDWNKDIFKTLLWHPAQSALLGKKSTTELNKEEDIDQVFEHLNRHIGEKFKIHVPFPHKCKKCEHLDCVC